MSAGTFEHTSISQEALKPEAPEIVQENQYPFPSQSHGFAYENAHQPEVTFPPSQTSSQMQNLASFSGVMVMHVLWLGHILDCNGNACFNSNAHFLE